MYCTYILQSEKTTQLYIGQTNNLLDRLARHNGNRNKWTKGKEPWKLIYVKENETRGEAMKLEKWLKGFKNKSYTIEWIKSREDNAVDKYIGS